MEWVPVIMELPVQDERTGDIVEMRKGISRYFARFEEDEKKILHNHLKKYPKEKIELFIGKLSQLCELYGYYIQQKNNKQNYNDIIQDLPKLENALQPLILLKKKLEEEGLSTPRGSIISVPDITQQDEEIRKHFTGLNQYCDCYSSATVAYESLKKIIDHLKEIKTYKELCDGRRKEGGFKDAVENLFKETFKAKPSSTKDGELSSILQICLDGMGLPHNDPGRRLKKKD